MYLINKYWPEGLLFAAIFGGLLLCLSPGMTWMNTDSDGAHYILASKYMLVAHNTSAPLYLLLGRLFLYLPIGSDAYRMGLISVIASTFAAIMIYKTVRLHLQYGNRSRLFAGIAALIYGGSALVISQSTIIETYPLATSLLITSYYFTVRKQWVRSSILLGLTLAIHPLLFGIIWLVMVIAHKELRNVKLIAMTWSFAIFYLYVPIVTYLNDAPNMWGNNQGDGFIKANFGTLMMLTGGLSMYDLPKRIIDTVLILFVSMGLGTGIVIHYFARLKKWKSILLWLVLWPAIYFATNLAAETYVYLILAVAFGSIVTGIALAKINIKWAYATLVIAVLMMGFNINYYDIGRTLDPEMSTEKFYNEELIKIPDGDIYMAGGWTWAIIYLYNKEHGTNIIPVCTDTLPNDGYLNTLNDIGVEYTPSSSESYITRQGEVALSIAELNDNVWIAKEVKPEVYQYVVEPAIGNESYIGRWIGEEITPTWRFEPSNPYKYISGELEISEWHHILRSNRDAKFLLSVFLWVFIIMYVWDRYSKKRKKNEVRK